MWKHIGGVPGLVVHISPVSGRLRQKDLEFETSLGYTVKPCLKKNKNQSKSKINK
jgi:hypothetical protein